MSDAGSQEVASCSPSTMPGAVQAQGTAAGRSVGSSGPAEAAKPATDERSAAVVSGAVSLASVIDTRAHAFGRLDGNSEQPDLFGLAHQNESNRLVHPVERRRALPSELEKIPSKFIKIAGKNRLAAELYQPLNAKIPEIIAWLDHHHPGAAFMFDGDNNEEDATFSQLIAALVVAGRYVLSIKDYGDNRPLSHAYVHGWKSIMSERTEFYFLRLQDDTKEAITKTCASGSLYVASFMESERYKKDAATGKRKLDAVTNEPLPTQGYSEIIDLMQTERRVPIRLFDDDSVIFL